MSAEQLVAVRLDAIGRLRVDTIERDQRANRAATRTIHTDTDTDGADLVDSWLVQPAGKPQWSCV